MLVSRFIILFSSLMIGNVTPPAQASPVTQMALRGNLCDCLKGKTTEVGGIDVYVYDLPAAANFNEELRRLEDLRSRANDGGAAEFFAAYERMEKTVTSGKFPAKHAISDAHGRFVIDGLAAGRDFLVLAIGLKVEDEGAYYNFQRVKLHDDSNSITIWMTPGEQKNCSNQRL